MKKKRNTQNNKNNIKADPKESRKLSPKVKRGMILSLILVLALAATIAFLFVAQNVLMPKYTSGGVPEGALVSEYYAESHIEHDVIFVGDCEVYESFIPAKLWEEYGISSYVRGSAQQLVWQSYYLLEEMFEYEKPKVVVFNVLSLKYGEPQNEAYNRMTLDGMKLSDIKLDAVRASMTEGESLLSYIFPILRYHSRWSSLEGDDFKYAFKSPAVSDSGYLMQTDIVPQTENPSEGSPLVDYTLPARAMEYLEKMRVLCEKNGAELVLVKSPTNNWRYYWYDEWDKQVSDYAEAHSLHYYNFIDLRDEIGIDFSTDTYDAGVHLNVYGAEKLTSYFGEILAEEFDLRGHPNNWDLEMFWREKISTYYARKQEMSNR